MTQSKFSIKNYDRLKLKQLNFDYRFQILSPFY
jgi:hypothetical protein